MGNKFSSSASSLPEDDNTSLDNLHFYQNKIQSHPNGDYIDTIHKKWFGDYYLLESNHSFIQWLFPLRESGMNWSSQPLTKHEAQQMRSDTKIMERLLKSLSLMMDFWGIYFDADKRQIMRSASSDHMLAQYRLLNGSFHNYLRITRILKCLGILGCEDLKFELLNHLVLEVFQTQQLERAEDSCIKFWIPTLRRREDVRKMDQLVEKFSQTGRSINREARDGWGDEDGENWSTQFYPDELHGNYTQDVEFQVREQILTADQDPFSDIRQQYEYSLRSGYLESLRSDSPASQHGRGNRSFSRKKRIKDDATLSASNDLSTGEKTPQYADYTSDVDPDNPEEDDDDDDEYEGEDNEGTDSYTISDGDEDDDGDEYEGEDGEDDEDDDEEDLGEDSDIEVDEDNEEDDDDDDDDNVGPSTVGVDSSLSPRPASPISSDTFDEKNR